jgi:hypothetical protein
MPIRFRCGRCNQLMGIARRKAGTTIQCPTCHSPVVVPQEQKEAAPPLPAAQPVGDAPAPLFERSDFEAFLHEPRPANPPAAASPPLPAPSFAFEAEPVSAPSVALSQSNLRTRPAGLMLSPTQATWLTVVVILLVALAFGAGLLVGHYWMG